MPAATDIRCSHSVAVTCDDGVRRCANCGETPRPDPVAARHAKRVKRILGRVALVCQECGRKWSVSANAADPQCPKCGGVDYEVA